MAENSEQQLNFIEETVLKKRKHSEEWAIRRRQQLLERQWKIKENKKLAFKRPEDYIKEYRSKELDLVKMKHRVKRPKTCTTPSSNLLFVIRIQGKKPVHPQIQKIFKSLGLNKKFTGVFLKATQGTLALLEKVEPYVTYGYPNLKNVKDLIYKKGLAKLEKDKVPLTDNNVIEQALGKHGILCLEDIVHEIFSVGRHFKEVTRFLWPFSLAKPKDGFQGKKNTFKNGGDSGNREEHINDLIALMT